MQYRVVETIQFSVAESLLQGLAHFLSLNPYYFPLLETNGELIGLRWVDFIPGSSVRVEIWYSAVEDDLTGYLESVEVIYPPQPSLPGFGLSTAASRCACAIICQRRYTPHQEKVSSVPEYITQGCSQ